MQTVYIETSVVSFYRDNPQATADSVQKQASTRIWWNEHRNKYELVTSQYVVDEAGVGNPQLASERLDLLGDLPRLPLGDQIDQLATEIIDRAILPQDAIVDALHIACAAVHRIDYLLTWNCKHLANPITLPQVYRVIDDFSLPFPVVCTPDNLLESYGNAEIE